MSQPPPPPLGVGTDAAGNATEQDPLWQPSERRIAEAAMSRFAQMVRADLRLADDAEPFDLHRWSVEHADDFWELVFAEAVQRGERGEGPVSVDVPRPPGRSYFPSARVSYAEELLAGGERPGAAPLALIYRREDGFREEWSWSRLRAAVEAVAVQLRGLGVGPGDVVGAWLPNAPAAVIAMLATSSLGAVYTSASPDFGADGLADRFDQVSPRVLVVADGYFYGGKAHERLSLLPDVVALLPSVQSVLVASELGTAPGVLAVAAGALPDDVEVAALRLAADESAGLDLAAVPRGYDDDGFVLYSSGTTGAPKCIVHSALGLLLKHWTEHVLHCDIRPGDRVFFFTTCGWMMWNWLVGALAVGATIVLYDGSPLHDDGTVLWRLAQDEQVTFFGAGAKFYDSTRKAGLHPGADFDLHRVRTVASTGSPLAAADFRFLYDELGPDIHLASISGGTDICGCFVLGDPTRPVFAGEIQGPALGADIDVIDADARTVRAPEPGELVCRNRFPSMPLRFGRDPDGTRYQAAYFSDHPGLWTHGDFAHWTAHGGIVITGRSDATLNAGGVRIGTAEIYRQVEQFDEVAEALAVGQEYDDDTRIVLFLRLVPGAVLDDDLRGRIRTRLRVHASPRHVPAVILAADDFPRTRSGKLAELAVADAVNGRTVRNTHALANPESLRAFADLRELAPPPSRDV